MSDKSLRALALLTGAALLAVIAVGGIVGSHDVAVDLQGKAERALVAAGLDGVDVDLSGREARLRGGSTLDRAEAGAVVARIRGVRSVHVAGAARADGPAPAPGSGGPARVVLTRTSGGVQIGGTVPTPDAVADLKAAAAEAFGQEVTGDLVIDPVAVSADWVAVLPHVLAGVADVHQLVLDIDGDRAVEIAGSVVSPGRKAAILRLLRASFPGLTLTDRLTVGQA